MDERAQRFLADELAGLEKRLENTSGPEMRQAIAMEEIAKQLIKLRFLVSGSIGQLMLRK